MADPTDNPDAALVEAMKLAIRDAVTDFDGDPVGVHLSNSAAVDASTCTVGQVNRVVDSICLDAATAALAALRRVRPDNKTFPVIGFGRIPWSVAERAYDSYVANFGGRGQSLERVAERGGFYVGEMDQQLPGWREECTAIGKLAKLEAENAGLRARIANLENPQPPETTP